MKTAIFARVALSRLIGDGSDVELRALSSQRMARCGSLYLAQQGRLTVSPFSITGSRNFNLYDGNGRPDSNGVLGQIDFTPWGAGNSPLGPRFNARVGVQYTLYGKFNGRRHNYDLAARMLRTTMP